MNQKYMDAELFLQAIYKQVYFIHLEKYTSLESTSS